MAYRGKLCLRPKRANWKTVLVLIQLKDREFTADKRDVNFLTRGNICRYTIGVSSWKMVYKRVKGWTSRRKLPVYNFVEHTPGLVTRLVRTSCIQGNTSLLAWHSHVTKKIMLQGGGGGGVKWHPRSTLYKIQNLNFSTSWRGDKICEIFNDIFTGDLSLQHVPSFQFTNCSSKLSSPRDWAKSGAYIIKTSLFSRKFCSRKNVRSFYKEDHQQLPALNR